jgi:hypothetical protein
VSEISVPGELFKPISTAIGIGGGLQAVTYDQLVDRAVAAEVGHDRDALNNLRSLFVGPVRGQEDITMLRDLVDKTWQTSYPQNLLTRA